MNLSPTHLSLTYNTVAVTITIITELGNFREQTNSYILANKYQAKVANNNNNNNMYA